MTAMAMMKDDNRPPDQPLPALVPNEEPAYTEAIERAIERIKKRSLVDAKLAVNNVNNPEAGCFGVLWFDPVDGECPLDGTNNTEKCPLRYDCESTYTDAQAHLHERSLLRQPVVAAPSPPPPPESAPQPVVVAPPSVVLAPVVPIDAPKEKSRRARKNSPAVPTLGKWAGTGKYQRTGYQAQNRPVDKALDQLVEILGNPAVLPTTWKPNDFQQKYGHLGKIVLSRAASYTTVIVDGQTVMRCWTNANNCMLVDIVDQLVKPMQSIKGITKVFPIPKSSERKLRPCTHRFELFFSATIHSEAVGAIGGFLRMFYSV